MQQLSEIIASRLPELGLLGDSAGLHGSDDSRLLDAVPDRRLDDQVRDQQPDDAGNQADDDQEQHGVSDDDLRHPRSLPKPQLERSSFSFVSALSSRSTLEGVKASHRDIQYRVLQEFDEWLLERGHLDALRLVLQYRQELRELDV